MPERLRVRFENGTGGVVYTITGDLVPSSIAGASLASATVQQRLELPPMLVLDKLRFDTPGAAALFRGGKPTGIHLDRIVAVEWIGNRDV